jgi:DNA polymerase III subunit delta'
VSSDLSIAWKAPRGHASTIENLWGLAREGRLPHGLFFHGPAGIGKFAAMEWLARGLLCDVGPGQPCGKCGPCKRLAVGSHPDILRLDPVAEDQEELTIHFIAQRDERPESAYKGTCVEEFLSLRAGEGGWRVVLLRETERMNESAQNAFLKTLEEPSSNVLLAMECGRPGALLETVRSRVVEVGMSALGEGDTRAILAEHGIEVDEVTQLARMGEGSPGRALDLHKHGALLAMESMAAAFRGDRPPAVLRTELFEIDGKFSGRTATAQKRSRVTEWLDLLIGILRDHERFLAGFPTDRLPLGTWASAIPAVAESLRRVRLDHVLQARQDVGLNLAPETLLERALTSVAPILMPARSNSRR